MRSFMCASGMASSMNNELQTTPASSAVSEKKNAFAISGAVRRTARLVRNGSTHSTAE